MKKFKAWRQAAWSSITGWCHRRKVASAARYQRLKAKWSPIIKRWWETKAKPYIMRKAKQAREWAWARIVAFFKRKKRGPTDPVAGFPLGRVLYGLVIGIIIYEVLYFKDSSLRMPGFLSHLTGTDIPWLWIIIGIVVLVGVTWLLFKMKLATYLGKGIGLLILAVLTVLFYERIEDYRAKKRYERYVYTQVPVGATKPAPIRQSYETITEGTHRFVKGTPYRFQRVAGFKYYYNTEDIDQEIKVKFMYASDTTKSYEGIVSSGGFQLTKGTDPRFDGVWLIRALDQTGSIVIQGVR